MTSLKDQIEAARREAARPAPGSADYAKRQEEYARDARDRLDAEAVVTGLPEAVKAVIGKGGHAVSLCACGEAVDVRSLAGVAKHVHQLLTREGVAKDVFVDLDLDNSPQTNWLMFRV